MKIKVLFAAVLCSGALSVSAQESMFGGRYSNYEVDFTSLGISVQTDRANSIGLFGSHRSGPLVFSGYVDHDFDADVGLFDFFDVASFERDRAEVSLGYGITDFVDLEGALRYDAITVGVADFFTESATADVEGAQLGIGASFHSSPDARYGWLVRARYYFGEVDVTDFASLDVSTIRLEASFPIRIPDTPWVIVPGVEWEQFETDDQFFSSGFLLDIESNRFMIGLAYDFGGK